MRTDRLRPSILREFSGGQPRRFNSKGNHLLENIPEK